MSNRFQRVILLPGIHKTGSTAIQEHLGSQKEKLVSEQSLLPVVVQREITTALAAAELVAPEARKEAFFAALLDFRSEEEQQVETLLLSWEGFAGGMTGGYSEARERTQFLVECLGDEPVEVFLFLRRQDEYVESLYLHLIKNARAEEFGRFYDEHVRGVNLDWNLLCDSWEAAFGAGNLFVRLYEKDVDGDAFLSGVMSWLSIDQTGEIPAVRKRENPTLNKKGLELMLEIARQTESREEIRQCRMVVESLFPRLPGENFCLLSKDQRAELHEKYDGANRALMERLGEKSDRFVIPLELPESSLGEPEGGEDEVSTLKLVQLLGAERIRRLEFEGRIKRLERHVHNMNREAVEGGGFVTNNLFWEKYKSLSKKLKDLKSRF